jgi:hypothetical protein
MKLVTYKPYYVNLFFERHFLFFASFIDDLDSCCLLFFGDTCSIPSNEGRLLAAIHYHLEFIISVAPICGFEKTKRCEKHSFKKC